MKVECFTAVTKFMWTFERNIFRNYILHYVISYCTCGLKKTFWFPHTLFDGFVGNKSLNTVRAFSMIQSARFSGNQFPVMHFQSPFIDLLSPQHMYGRIPHEPA